jgi:uncharacterized membrane protein YbhN (UPF0104 family)
VSTATARFGQGGPAGSRLSIRGRWLFGVTTGAALLVLALPAATGVPWASAWQVVGSVPVLDLAGLAVVWALGLLSHTITLDGGLPTLGHRRALTLSLTGSAVANVLPLGGAAGIALNYRMASHWGFSGAQFATYTVVTNAWDVLAKLMLPLLVVPIVAPVARAALGPMAAASIIVAVGLGVLVVLSLAVLASPALTDRAGRLADWCVGGLLRVVRSTREVRTHRALVDIQASCGHLVRTRWHRLTLGMALYTALLFVLLFGCLQVTHAGVAPAAVLAGFAVERLLTLAGITPGGAGVVEVGLTGALIALGGGPGGVVGGVLVYRALTYGLEIPVGGLGLAAWLWRRRRADRRVA